MKKIKFMALFLSMALVFGSCGSMNNTSCFFYKVNDRQNK